MKVRLRYFKQLHRKGSYDSQFFAPHCVCICNTLGSEAYCGSDTFNSFKSSLYRAGPCTANSRQGFVIEGCTLLGVQGAVFLGKEIETKERESAIQYPYTHDIALRQGSQTQTQLRAISLISNGLRAAPTPC